MVRLVQRDVSKDVTLSAPSMQVLLSLFLFFSPTTFFPSMVFGMIAAVWPSGMLNPVMTTPPSTSSVVNMLAGDGSGSACTAGAEAAACAPVSGAAVGTAVCAPVCGSALFAAEPADDVRVF